jgi:hypothetical protein
VRRVFTVTTLALGSSWRSFEPRTLETPVGPASSSAGQARARERPAHSVGERPAPPNDYLPLPRAVRAQSARSGEAASTALGGSAARSDRRERAPTGASVSLRRVARGQQRRGRDCDAPTVQCSARVYSPTTVCWVCTEYQWSFRSVTTNVLSCRSFSWSTPSGVV